MTLTSLHPVVGELPDPRTLLIGVVTGGISRERGRSLLSGSAVCESLTRQGYQVRRLDLAEDQFVGLVTKVDLAFLAIAGQYAEDGKLQGLLELLGVPYTGSGVLASAVAMNKPFTKKVMRAHSLPVPDGMEFHRQPGMDPDQLTETIAQSLGVPVIFKPASEGCSIGITVAHNRDEIMEAIRSRLSSPNGEFVVERFHRGISASVGVLGTEERELVALPVLEVRTQTEFYDYETKTHATMDTYACPSKLSPDVTEALQRHAMTLHRALGCRSHSRSDFIVDDTNGAPLMLEINTLPGLSRTGNLATMAAAGGIEFDDLIRHITTAALARRAYEA